MLLFQAREVTTPAKYILKSIGNETSQPPWGAVYLTAMLEGMNV
jgi:hypothetical protein